MKTLKECEKIHKCKRFHLWKISWKRLQVEPDLVLMVGSNLLGYLWNFSQYGTFVPIWKRLHESDIHVCAYIWKRLHEHAVHMICEIFHNHWKRLHLKALAWACHSCKRLHSEPFSSNRLKTGNENFYKCEKIHKYCKRLHPEPKLKNWMKIFHLWKKSQMKKCKIVKKFTIKNFSNVKKITNVKFSWKRLHCEKLHKKWKRFHVNFLELERRI